ncbi:Uncharacterized protein FKW44_016213, partial [Caligus rogercresseyi]
VELEVKSVGLIPCKIRKGDPITWKSVVEIHHPDKTAVPIIGDLLQSEGTLGCSICKGPPDRPGVFVQSISNTGIAWKSGLRIGDQILSCNGVDFKDYEEDFSRVIRVLKSSKLLHLYVRKNAGREFLCGNDSSGYDSTEEKPVLKEEESTPPPQKDQELEALQQERRRLELLHKEREEIQRLKDERNELERLRRLESIRIEREKLTVEQEKLKAQAQSLAKEKEKFEMEKQNQIRVKSAPNATLIHSPPIKPNEQHPKLVSQSSVNSNTSSLVNAIQSEIQRRTLRKSLARGSSEATPPPPPPHKKKEAIINSLQNENHDKLIEEFRSVHRKMFSSAQKSPASDGTEKTREYSEEESRLEVIEYTDSDDITVPNFLTDESSNSSGGEESKGPENRQTYPLRQKNSLLSNS